MAILGGGVAGLTAAHELAERGFQVTVYERRAFGGKARSFGVPGSARGGRLPLPAEHGARFIPGIYQNPPDTMRRIPFGSNPNGTFDNLVTANQECYARSGGQEDWNISFTPIDTRGWSLEQLRQTLIASLQIATRLPAQEVAYFVDRLYVFFSSCDARRFGEWEHMSWWDYVAAGRYSEEYRRLLISSATRLVLGSKATEACARTLGLLWEGGVYNFFGRGDTGPWDRVLNAPTNQALIDPWLAHLRTLGVELRLGAEVERLELRGQRVGGAVVRHGGRRETVDADWFILAVPVERARRLLTPEFISADPRLAGLDSLVTRWMNGLQFYLRSPTPIVHGHVLYIDSPWALASISQAQFWAGRGFARTYGDGSAHDCISVDIADFETPGIVYRRPARELTPAQIAREVWEQMKASLNDTGRETLRDDQVLRWYLDPGLVFSSPGRRPPTNQDPLFISTPGAWQHRPDCTTTIPNLFLAADYVRVNIDTASMEGANEAGRRAANAILARAGAPARPATVYALYQPHEWEPFRRSDQQAYAHGLPNAFEVPPPPPTPTPGGGTRPSIRSPAEACIARFLKAIWVLAAAAVCAAAFGVGVPLFWVWLASQLQNSADQGVGMLAARW